MGDDAPSMLAAPLHAGVARLAAVKGLLAGGVKALHAAQAAWATQVAAARAAEREAVARCDLVEKRAHQRVMVAEEAERAAVQAALMSKKEVERLTTELCMAQSLTQATERSTTAGCGTGVGDGGEGGFHAADAGSLDAMPPPHAATVETALCGVRNLVTTHLTCKVSDMTAGMAALRHLVATCSAEVAQANAEAVQTAAAAEAASQALARAQQDRAALEEEVQGLKVQVATALKEVGGWREEAARWQRACDDKDATIAVLEQDASRVRTVMAGLEKQLAAKSELVAQGFTVQRLQEATLDRLRQEVVALRKEQEALPRHIQAATAALQSQLAAARDAEQAGREAARVANEAVVQAQAQLASRQQEVERLAGMLADARVAQATAALTIVNLEQRWTAVQREGCLPAATTIPTTPLPTALGSGHDVDREPPHPDHMGAAGLGDGGAQACGSGEGLMDLLASLADAAAAASPSASVGRGGATAATGDATMDGANGGSVGHKRRRARGSTPNCAKSPPTPAIPPSPSPHTTVTTSMAADGVNAMDVTMVLEPGAA